jgi:hypothetical protein
MKKDERFKLLIKEAENDLFLLQKEALALQTELDAAAGTEAELKILKEQWLKKEQLLRFLAIRSSKKCSTKIRLLRITATSHIMRTRKAAKTPVILSCTSKTLPLQDVLKGVKFRRASFNRWLSNSPYSLSEEALIVHKQSFVLLQDIDILANRVKQILKMRQEVKGLKKAVGDIVKFLESNQSLISPWCSTLTSSWEILKPYIPEECAKEKNTDVKSVSNFLNIPNNVLKTHEEILSNDINTGSGRGSYQGDYETRATNVPEVIPALQNEIMITDDDIEAILRDCETEFPNRNFDEVSIPFEYVDCTENNSSYDCDSFISSTDKETEVQKAADTCNYEKDNTQFRSDARGTLLAFAACEDVSSTACQLTAYSSTVTRKEACTYNTNVCNLPEEHASVDESDVFIHHSMQDACDLSTDFLSWLDPFSERSKHDDGDILSLEEWAQMNQVLSNETATE